MPLICYSHLIFLLPLIISSSIEANGNRQRRQIPDGTNRNVAGPQQKPPGSIPWNNFPYNPSNNPNVALYNPSNNPNVALYNPSNNPNVVPYNPSNNPYVIPYNPPNNPNVVPYNPSNNPNVVPYNPPNNPNVASYNPSNNPNVVPANNLNVVLSNNPNVIPTNKPTVVPSNDRNNPKQMNTNNQLPMVPQTQMEPARNPGFNNNPSFQQPPFPGEKQSGWFGTNQHNWISTKDSELDKNKLAAGKTAAPANSQVNTAPTQRQDGGPFFLQKVAKLYASKGEKAFNFGQFETRQGRGSWCSNHENFEGYSFGVFPCPLPPSTGMNQLDQFCCGPANYQYCCNIQEFGEHQRGAFTDPRMFSEQRFPKRPDYPPTTRRILAIILPIAGFVVLAGVGVLVFLYYKRFRTEQHRARKLSGAIRLEDTYSIVPQELPMEKTGSFRGEQ